MLAIASILNRSRGRVDRSHDLWWRWQRWCQGGLLVVLSLTLGTSLTSCREQAIANPRRIAIDQSWELAPGDPIEGFLVVAGLGDISVHMKGAPVRAPFDGEVEAAAVGDDCIFFSSPEVPAYLFRYCGLRRPRLGTVTARETMGRANFLHFATLRRQPEGTWVIVEPSTNVLERSLERY